ncbi:unnamed protein product [Rotaria sordida]|uniref:Uncharacterized protein n=1 Tax=Rotaria sordida TaxID=392033 RepID=A0A815V6M8_9BILA|nr:unnamed protein product [Rotaria sordida]CAF1523975.1 unnamed protein product [Rotaria sordida]
MADFLALVCHRENIFGRYLLTYSLYVENNDLWEIFLNISRKSDINEIIQKYFISILKKQILIVSIETYFQFINSAMECFLNIQTQYQENFLKILQTCFDAFVEKKCLDEQYSYQLSEINLKNLLRIGFRLSLMRTDIQQSCLLIIRRLLFNVNEDLRDTYDKLMQLFRKVNDFDENLRNKYDPTVVIQDDWLQDYIISIPEDWLKLNQEIYQNLCETHRNNRWIIYIWSRIVCLSLLKVKNENSNEILLKLNEWIQNVKHDVYDANDTLTIIFVIHVFEIIIARSNRSIVSFPNIKCIMNIIIQIRQEQQNRLNVKQVDDFIQSGQQFIQNILSLKGNMLNIFVFFF